MTKFDHTSTTLNVQTFYITTNLITVAEVQYHITRDH